MRQPIACTDEGTIYRRYGPNDWRLVFIGPEWDPATSGGFDYEIAYYMDSTKGDPRWIRGNFFADTDVPGEFNTYPIWSRDGGETWEYPFDYRTVRYLDRQFDWGACGGGGWDYIKDVDGTLYGLSRYLNQSGGHSYFHKSKDKRGIEWEEAFDWTALTGLGFIGTHFYMADGYFWWTDSPDGARGFLYRVRPDGTGYAAFDIGLSDGEETTWMKGWYDAHRLVTFDTFTSTQMASIDITDPDNPVLTTRVPPDSPEFGEDPEDSHIEFQHVQPVTNQVILAMVHNTGAPVSGDPVTGRWPPGSVWRSADAGRSWSVVIPETYDLSHGGYYNEFNTIAVDPDDANRIVCGMAPPYVFISEDRGLTWTREIVDLSGGNAVGRDLDIDDREWTSFAWGDNTPLFPGLARKQSDGSDVWFRGEF